MKPQLPKITEPDQDLVHYSSDGLSGNATLCGLTDFLGAKEKGEETDAAVTCYLCKSIVKYVHRHAKPKDLG
jgi:hypothetical protein